MSTSRFALLVGFALGVVAIFGGAGFLMIVAVFTAVGWAVGLVLEGKLDVSALAGRVTDRR